MKKTLALAAALTALNVFAEVWPKVIFPGDFPDPSIIRDGEDYYITFSGLEYRPGLVIYHSRDLIHWQAVASAAENTPGSVWAPDIAKTGGGFAIYFPANGIRGVAAPAMKGPWSGDFRLDFEGGIDPGVLAAANGERWLWVNNGNAKRLAADGRSVTGELRHFYDGWRFPLEWKTENDSRILYLESPKLFRRGEWYYLVSAEGGTAGPATSHMAAVARAKRPEGPWENSPYNPLIHTWSESEDWWSTGHATVFEDAKGDWWTVYHGYRKGAPTLGRSTLLAPVAWTEDGWPVLDRSGRRAPLPAQGEATIGDDFTDDFAGDRLNLRWGLYGEGQLKYAAVKDSALELEASGWGANWGTLAAFVPSVPRYTASVEAETLDGAEAGLVLVYNRHHLVGVTTDGRDFIIYNDTEKPRRVPSKLGKKVTFTVVNDSEKATFIAEGADGAKATLIDRLDVSGLQHNRYGGFMSLRIALSCNDKGKKARFRHFVYRGEKTRELPPWRDPVVIER